MGKCFGSVQRFKKKAMGKWKHSVPIYLHSGSLNEVMPSSSRATIVGAARDSGNARRARANWLNLKIVSTMVKEVV